MKTSTGATFDIGEMIELYECGENPGVCMACGELAFGVEPDAEGYDCEFCGQPAVVGVEIAMLGA